jgi:hypothetical protein
MASIEIKIQKTLTVSEQHGNVTLRAYFPQDVGITEATRFYEVFGDVLRLATRWQDYCEPDQPASEKKKNHVEPQAVMPEPIN